MIISIISSIIVYGCAALLIIRLLSQSGIIFKNKYALAAAKDLRISNPVDKFEKYELLKVFIIAFAFRMFMYLMQAMALYWFLDFPNIGQLNEFSGTFAKMLRQFEMWDGTNYFRIADGGYGSHIENGRYTMLAFFPLQSWTARVLSLIFRNIRVSLLMTSTLAYCGGITVLYKLTALDYSRETAKKAAVYISLFPFSFFFGSMMAESMLFFTTVLALYFIRQHKWLFAGIAGAFAAMSRIVGIFVIFAAIIEFIEYYKLFEMIKEKKIKEAFLIIVKNGLWLLIMLAGIAVYLLLNWYYTKDAFIFLEYQHSVWGHESCYFGQGIANVINSVFNSDNVTYKISIFIPFTAILIGSAALIIYGIRRNRTMYTAFALIYMVVITSVTYVPSGTRYTICAVPLFMLLADFSERHKGADTVITTVFALMQGMYFIAYLKSMAIF